MRADTPLRPAWFYKPRRNYRGSVADSDTGEKAAVDPWYREVMQLCPMAVLTKVDEPTVDHLRDSGYERPVLCYVLAWEVRLPTSSGATTSSNNWTFGGSIGVPLTFTGGNVFVRHQAWDHFGETTTTGVTAIGAASFTVTDGAEFQNITGPKCPVDVFSSGGVYQQTIYYGTVVTNTISGVPTTGDGSIGIEIPAGSIVRPRVKTSLSGSYIALNVSDQTMRDWCAAQWVAYRESEIGTDWSGLFLDNVMCDLFEWTGLQSPDTLPIEWASVTDFYTAAAAWVAWVCTNMRDPLALGVSEEVWGNTFSARQTSVPDHTNALVAVADYLDAGLDGGMIEDFGWGYSGVESADRLRRQLAFAQEFIDRGRGIILVGQIESDTASRILYFSACALLIAQDGITARASESGFYQQWWGNNAYHARLGVPTGAAVESPTGTWSRTFTNGSVSVVPATSTGTITVTDPNG